MECEGALNERGKIDYTKVRPFPFEMPTRTYFRTEDIIRKYWLEGKGNCFIDRYEESRVYYETYRLISTTPYG